MSVGNDLLYLCSCAVNQVSPRHERVAEMDLEKLYALAQSQSLTALTACALEAADGVSSRFQEVLLKSIRKNMMLDYERKKLTDFMNEAKIWHLPLKGVLLQNLYPRAGMRQMSDNDILFDESRRGDVREYMLRSGYESVRDGDTIVDEYHKQPLYNFEMHITLFHPKDEKLPHFHTYYKDIDTRLERERAGSYTMRMTAEDFYVYLLAHAYKHYTFCGIGIRTLIDFYVYLKAYAETMDWEKIETACEALGITEYESQSRILCRQLFSDPEHIECSEAYADTLQFYFSSGTYGTLENRVTNQLQSLGAEKEPVTLSMKLKYLWQRFTLTDAVWERISPFAYRHRWARGFVRIYHIVRALITKQKYVRDEFRTLIRKK